MMIDLDKMYNEIKVQRRYILELEDDLHKERLKMDKMIFDYTEINSKYEEGQQE